MVGLEPTIPAAERPQTYALDHAATGTGNTKGYRTLKLFSAASVHPVPNSLFTVTLNVPQASSRPVNFHIQFLLIDWKP
jgi:hypothetical protein